MDNFSELIIGHRKTVITLTIILSVICLVLIPFVGINYDLVDYLPSEAQSTKALNVLNAEFEETIPNTRVMVKDVTLMEAIQYKKQIASIQGVTQVIWLDDMIDVRQPLEMADAVTVEGFYRDGDALFTVTLAKNMEKDATNQIRKLIGDDNHVSGDAPGLVAVMDAAVSTVIIGFIILLPAILLILILSTTSWLEPLIFLAAIGISIVINMGTNIFFKDISFMTNSISPILQLAVSLDYAVFLLHSFIDNKKKYPDVNVAMKHAMKESMSTVAASAATTLFGFLALLFMNFRIGADLGLNLAKGIVFSFASVMIFLPALTLTIYKWIDKTQHRPLMPDLSNINRVLSKVALPAVIIIVLMIVPTFLGQGRTGYLYDNNPMDPNIRYGRDTLAIEDRFGKSTIMVLLVPKGDAAREGLLSREVEGLEHVTGILSYAQTVGTAIPPEYLGPDITKQFYSENYARLIVYTDTPSEGDVAFQTVETINTITRGYYGDKFLSLGQSANLYDMKGIIEKDNIIVNLIAIVAIFIVLLATFRSAILPFILVLVIETGIWINLSIPYFSGIKINFLGYLILSTVQLGATVDYAILLTNTYLTNRKRLSKMEAVSVSLGGTFKSILVSALTLSAAGFTLYKTSSNSSISDIGLLLGRGTLLSLAMVLLFLPTLLTVFDGAIGKFTRKAEFMDTKRKIGL